MELDNCKVSQDIVNCHKKFDNYQWISEFPKKGAYGYIYNIYNKKISKETILKVQPYGKKNIITGTVIGQSDADNEMKISCLVSELPNFVKLIDYWICDIEPIDDIWKSSKGRKEFIDDIPDSISIYNIKKLYYIEMEKYKGTISDIIKNNTPLSQHDKFCIIFELANALIDAYNKITFTHGDIHTGNMFYNFNNTPRQYTLYINKDGNSKKKKILTINCNSIFYPIWGDFGKSSLKNYDHRSIQYDLFDALIKMNGIDRNKTRFFETDTDFLIYLGKKVNKTESNKKQKNKS
jgi:hypothetical protein